MDGEKLNFLKKTRNMSNSPRLKRRSLLELLRKRWPWNSPLEQ